MRVVRNSCQCEAWGTAVVLIALRNSDVGKRRRALVESALDGVGGREDSPCVHASL